MPEIPIREADSVTISILTDNYTDLLMIQSTDAVRRLLIPPPAAPLAEHGFSCLVNVRSGADEHCVLMDTGVTSSCMIHNAGLLRADLGALDSVMLSHGHYDHFGGLADLLRQLHKKIPVVLHPDAFLDRKMNIPALGHPVHLPRLDKDGLTRAGAVLQRSSDPLLFGSDLLLATGEVERITSYEKGLPFALAYINGDWTIDPFHDDQGLVVKLKDKGLVVLSGCAHAGVINTVEYAKKITGTDKVHAVLGGFHLTGPLFDPVIPPTIKDMRAINPRYIVPMHCTGWKAVSAFAREMPDQFVLNTVGTTYSF